MKITREFFAEMIGQYFFLVGWRLVDTERHMTNYNDWKGSYVILPITPFFMLEAFLLSAILFQYGFETDEYPRD